MTLPQMGQTYSLERSRLADLFWLMTASPFISSMTETPGAEERGSMSERQSFGSFPFENGLAVNVNFICKLCLSHLFLLAREI